jgi:hypothetical protein
MVGAWVSLTVTVNEHEPLLPLASVTLHITVVMPFGNAEPDAGLHVTAPTPSQLSLPVGVVYVTTAEQRFESVLCVIGDGQVTDGASVSLTVTVNVQVAVLPAASVAVQVTVVMPFGNIEPD